MSAFLKLNQKMRLWRSMHENVPYVYMEQFCVFRGLKTSWHVLHGSIRLLQLTDTQPDLTGWSAAFLNCECASAFPLIRLSSPWCTGQQLNSMVLLKGLVLPFFFPVKCKRRRTWIFRWFGQILRKQHILDTATHIKYGLDLTLF